MRTVTEIIHILLSKTLLRFSPFLHAATRVMLVLFFLALPVIASTADRKPQKPAARDKCPVCGMFVAKYPDFIVEVVFRDGSRAYFDGAKDMFKYYFNLKKYNPSKMQADIDALFVTDYYSMNPADGFRAFYVVGSNVYGPMGRELIPFAKEADARQFMADHGGKSLLTFKEVTPDIIRKLD